jgi:hypothetical protein
VLVGNGVGVVNKKGLSQSRASKHSVFPVILVDSSIVGGFT